MIVLPTPPQDYNAGDIAQTRRILMQFLTGLEARINSTSRSGWGFGFEAEGRLVNDEDLGVAAWPFDVVFVSDDTSSYLISAPGSPAAVDAVFRFLDGSLAIVGTYTIPAGTRVGVLAWTVNPYVHPANTPLFSRGPATADATLATVNCLVAGTKP